MPIGDNLPSINSFTNDITDQQTFFNAIQSVINEICDIDIITLRQDTFPLQSDFEDAWVAKNGGDLSSLPIPIEQEFIWYDTSTNKINGYFKTIDDIRSNISGMNINNSGVNDVDKVATNPANSLVAFDGDLRTDFNRGGGLFSLRSGLTVIDASGGGFVSRLISTDAGTSNRNRTYPSFNHPFGTKLAFATFEYAATQEIATINVDGTSLVRLTNNAFTDEHPSWVGSLIAFSSNEPGNAQIYSMTDLGLSRTRLTNNANSDTNPAISPDGAKIAFLRTIAAVTDLWIMDVNGSNQTQLTTGGVTLANPPAWSFDQNWIYFGDSRIHEDGSGEEVWYQANSESAHNYITDTSFVPDNWLDTFFPLTIETPSLGTVPSPKSVAPFRGDEAVVYSGTAFPAILIDALAIDDVTSTGKVYQVSQFVDPAGNVRLLKEDILDGTLNYSSISSSEMPDDIDHLLILVDGVGAATAVSTLFLRLNGDVDANNYTTVYQRSNNATVTKVENLPGITQGMNILFAGNAAPATLNNTYAIWLHAIHDTDNLKQAVWEGGFTIGGIATAANLNQVNGFGIWNSTDAVSSVLLTLIAGLGNFAINSKVSYYGFPRSARFAY